MAKIKDRKKIAAEEYSLEWKVLSSSEKKTFKKWLKNDLLKEFPTKTFFTDLYNLNLLIKPVDKYFVEFLLYNKFVEKGKYNTLVLEKKFLKITGETIKDFIINLVISSFEDQTHKKIFNIYLHFMWEVYEYIKNKDIAKVTIEKKNVAKEELKLIWKYWEIIETIRKTYIIGFNNWILFFNQNFYQKQKGLNFNK